jgi:hypothetical protein
MERSFLPSQVARNAMSFFMSPRRVVRCVGMCVFGWGEWDGSVGGFVCEEEDGEEKGEEYEGEVYVGKGI